MFLYLRWNLGVSGVPEIYSIPTQVKELGKETQGEDSPQCTWFVSRESQPTCSTHFAPLRSDSLISQIDSWNQSKWLPFLSLWILLWGFHSILFLGMGETGDLE